MKLAERAGFEPAKRFPVYTLSRRAPSTTRTPLRKLAGSGAGLFGASCASPLAALGASLRLSQFVPDELVEPAKRFPVYTLSRRAPSTTRTPLRYGRRERIATRAPRSAGRAGY